MLRSASHRVKVEQKRQVKVEQMRMGKMNKAYQTAHEYQYLLYEGLENFLRMLELSKAKVSQAILTEVLEYEVDLHVAKQEWFENNFQEFFNAYVKTELRQGKNEYPLEGIDIYNVNTEIHEDLFSKFNEFLLDHGI